MRPGRWLPWGRVAGLAYGGLLLIVASTRIEPLRRDNPDFDIVGPGWLSVVVFGALAVAHGMLVAALAGRYRRIVPLLSRNVRSIAAHAPLLLVAPVAAVLVPVILVGAVPVLVSRVPPLVLRLRSQRLTVPGRVALVAVVVVALPGLMSSATDILNRGP